MFETILWGSLVRLVQVASSAAPTILIGLVVAGVFARLLGLEGTRRLFGSGSWRALVQAWVIGMLLPVCALGVIPIVRQMRAAGISGGTILAFAITAPLFNPLSLLYGLSLSEPFVILAFAGCSLIVVAGVGLAWDRIFPHTKEPTSDSTPVEAGVKRIVAVLVVGLRELSGPSLPYLLLGIFGSVMMTATLPAGSLGTGTEHGDPLAPLVMATVALPVYVTPLQVMGQLGSMFLHGNSVGAAFTLLALGAGLNLGLIAWAFRNYGPLRAITLLLILIAIVLLLSYVVEDPLYPSQVEPAGHTHAFDLYCCPFHYESGGFPALAWRKLQDTVSLLDWGALAMLGVLLTGGVLWRWLDPQNRLEAWLESTEPGLIDQVAWYNRPLPAPVLGMATLVGLVALSLAGCFTYYPPAKDAFEEMKYHKTELLTALTQNPPDLELAKYHIPKLDDWIRRMQVGVYLRRGSASSDQQAQVWELLDRLEALEDSIGHEYPPELRKRAWKMNEAYTELRKSYD